MSEIICESCGGEGDNPSRIICDACFLSMKNKAECCIKTANSNRELLEVCKICEKLFANLAKLPEGKVTPLVKSVFADNATLIRIIITKAEGK